MLLCSRLNIRHHSHVGGSSLKDQWTAQADPRTYIHKYLYASPVTVCHDRCDLLDGFCNVMPADRILSQLQDDDQCANE